MSCAASALKSVDLPTLGKPTMPHLIPMLPWRLKVPALLRRLAFGRSLAAVQPVRRPLRAFLDEDREDLDGVRDRGNDQLFLFGRSALEHVVHDLVAAPRSRMADADAQPPEILADVLGDVADAVVAGMAAIELQLRAARRQIDLVVYDEDVRRLDLVVAHGGGDGLPAQVHVRQRLQQPDPAARDRQLRRLAVQLLVLREACPMLAREQVREPEARIVPGELILRPGIAE